jgi:hypothetical protein
MLAFAIDHPSPATVILISGDRDYVYALSVLRLIRYRIIVLAPRSAHSSLLAQASVHVDWQRDILGKEVEGRGNDIINRSSPDAPSLHSNSTGKRAVHDSAAIRPSLSRWVQAGHSAHEQTGVKQFLPSISPGSAHPAPTPTSPELLALPAQNDGMTLIPPEFMGVSANSVPSEYESGVDGPTGPYDLGQSAGVSAQPSVVAESASVATVAPVVAVPGSLFDLAISAVSRHSTSTLDEPYETATHDEAADHLPAVVEPTSNIQSSNPKMAASALPRSVKDVSEESGSFIPSTLTASPAISPDVVLEASSDGATCDGTTAQLPGTAGSLASVQNHDSNTVASANAPDDDTPRSISTTTEASGSLSSAITVSPGVEGLATLTQAPGVSIPQREPPKAKQSFWESCRKTWDSLLPVARPPPAVTSSLPIVTIVTPSTSTEYSLVTATSNVTSPCGDSARSSLLSILGDCRDGLFPASGGASGPSAPFNSKEQHPPDVVQTSPLDGVVPNLDPGPNPSFSSLEPSPGAVAGAAPVPPLPPAQHPLVQATPKMSSDSQQAETVQPTCSTTHKPPTSTPAIPLIDVSGAHPLVADFLVMPRSSSSDVGGSPCSTSAAGASFSRPVLAMTVPSSGTMSSSRQAEAAQPSSSVARPDSTHAVLSACASSTVPVAAPNTAAVIARQNNANLFRGLIVELRERNLVKGCKYLELASAVAIRDPSIYARVGIVTKSKRPQKLFDRAAAAGILTVVPSANGVRTASLIRLKQEWYS